MRVHAYLTEGGFAAAIRLLPQVAPTFDSLHMPIAFDDVVMHPHGLVLVCGSTGSGKSTTLAALACEAMRRRSIVVVTLEDPIEYALDAPEGSIVRRRQIGRDVSDFASGLRDALREDPDVLLVGEMRDPESISLALTAAETGHLVLASIHSRGAASAIERIVDASPSERRNQVRVQLAESLRAVIGQRLLPRARGSGRIPAIEVLRVNHAVSSLIREARTAQIASAMARKNEGDDLARALPRRSRARERNHTRRRARRSRRCRRPPIVFVIQALMIRPSVFFFFVFVGCSSSPPSTVQDAGGLDVAKLPLDDASLDAPTSTDASPPAPHLTIDLAHTSVSGISSGGFMAAQFHVAFSSIMSGAAIFAGGPYSCSQGSVTTAETTCTSGSPQVAPLVTLTNQYASAGDIDDPTNLAAQHVFLFGGADDDVVAPIVVDALDAYYASFMASTSIDYVSRRPGTSHTWPTLTYGNPCDVLSSPYMGLCNYDGAGTALQQIYGTLAAPATTLSGQFVSVPQATFVGDAAGASVDNAGFAYVPASCAGGESCKVHVSFHGCLQSASSVGDAFYKNAGLNEWADTNHIVVLYPQTVASYAPLNPDGCWDFWGYDGADFAKKTGKQMAMVRAMIDWLGGP